MDDRQTKQFSNIHTSQKPRDSFKQFKKNLTKTIGDIFTKSSIDSEPPTRNSSDSKNQDTRRTMTHVNVAPSVEKLVIRFEKGVTNTQDPEQPNSSSDTPSATPEPVTSSLETQKSSGFGDLWAVPYSRPGSKVFSQSPGVDSLLTPDNISSTDNKIRNIVNEILQTEEAYLSRLRLVDQNFRRFFLEKADQSEKSYPSAKTIEDIFCTLSSIISFHTEFFLPEIKSRVQNWNTDSQIADIFLSYAPYFGLYTVYMNNYDTSCNLLDSACKKYQKFATDLVLLEKQPQCKNLRLTHHMLDPIQRVPRYKLFLTELVKNVPKDSPFRETLEKALAIMSASAQKANDRISSQKNALKMLEIQNMFVKEVDIVSAGRSYIKEGELLRKDPKKGKYSSCHLFLFSDIVIGAQKQGTNKFRKLFDFGFSSCSIQRNVFDDKQPNAFSLIGLNERVILATEKEDEKNAWVQSITITIKEYDEKLISFLIKNAPLAHGQTVTDHEPVLSSFARVIEYNKNECFEKYITLTSQHKLIFSLNPSPLQDDKAYSLHEAEISLGENAGNPIILLNISGTKFGINSESDDLFLERWTCVLKSCLGKKG